MNGTLSLVGDSNEDDIGAGPAKKSRSSDQEYAGLPTFQPVEPQNIDQNSRFLKPQYQEQPQQGHRPENYQQPPSHSGRYPLVFLFLNALLCFMFIKLILGQSPRCINTITQISQFYQDLNAKALVLVNPTAGTRNLLQRFLCKSPSFGKSYSRHQKSFTKICMQKPQFW